MVPCETILKKAKEYNVDIIGLSGLITPSLDEMIDVAREMSKAGCEQPLLIGGATTSKVHTAVKISPNFFTSDHPVVHVLDASRSVTVVSSLLSDSKEDYVADLSEEYEEIREDYYAGLEDRHYLSFKNAIENRLKIDFESHPVAPVPNTLGISVIDSVRLQDVVPYIDWNPFFQTWELRGRYPNRGYPKIFKDETVGAEAKKLFDDAQRMLKNIIENEDMYLKGVVGIFPANRSCNGEDVNVYSDEESRSAGLPTATFCMLRQQAVKESEDELDDFSKIMSQALADRFVEAFAEHLHRSIRVEMWGYAKDEKLDESDLLKIKYDGIRPAPGYPSQPDHTEKITMWNLIKANELAGIELSDSLSMMPAASVSALVFAHPESQYFSVGQIGKDQVDNYAERKKMKIELMERWLSPILNYERK